MVMGASIISTNAAIIQHQSTSDPECRLYRKSSGQEARLCYIGHAIMENRNGLIIDGMVSQATGTAERDCAEQLAGHIKASKKMQ